MDCNNVTRMLSVHFTVSDLKDSKCSIIKDK